MGKRFNDACALSNTGDMNGIKPGDGKGKKGGSGVILHLTMEKK
jgi:hypothetical protein